MTKVEALAFIHSHGSHVLAEDFAEEIAHAFGHSLGEIGIEPAVLTAAFPVRPFPGWEGRLVVPMAYLAAALAGMKSMPAQATLGLWHAISQFSVEAIERGHGVETGLGVEQITLRIHFTVQDSGAAAEKSGATAPHAA